MGTRNLLVIKPQFDLLLNRALFGKMVGVVASVLGWLLCVLRFVARCLLRFIWNEFDQGESMYGGEKLKEEEEGDDEDERVSSSSKYEFSPLRGINGFVEEPKAVSFTVHELYFDSDDVVPRKAEEEFVDSDNGDESLTREDESSEKSTALNDSVPESSETLDAPETFLGSGEFTFHFSQTVPETFLDIARIREQAEEDESSEKSKALTLPEKFMFHPEQSDQTEEDGSSEMSKALLLPEKLTFQQEQHDPADQFTRQEDEPEALTFTEFPVLRNKIAPAQEQDDEADDFTGREEESSRQFSLSFAIFDDKIVRELQDEQIGHFGNEAVESKDSASPFENRSSFGEEDDDIIIVPHSKLAEGEYIELQPGKEEEEKKKAESEWEHDDVIEQLKWELRKARTGGLATIMEEESGSDSPAASPAVEVGPGKVELSFKVGYKESMGEIQKVYRSYLERMRKLDILNTQTMHAIGFLQLKHHPKPIQKQKKTFLPRRAQKDDDPALEYTEKLQNDFELVYVGQICLSWEMLTWQRRKLRDHSCLHNNVARRYNLVASEFQLFRVLIQRFVEDESFRGPRVQNYTKSRCVIRSLVQVPIIRDDFAKDKQYVLEGDEDSVSCERLSRVILEAMFAFWDFIRRDEKSNVGVRISKETLIGEAVDSKLLMDIKRDFQKKERRVKDIERSGNCVVKKLQKWHKEEEEKEYFWCEGSLFLAQVELRLVSRVLSMSTLTRDRLLWCQHKLNQITFSNRKLHFEPSFLLFPC